MRKVKNESLTLIEMPDGSRLLPGEVRELSEAHEKNSGVRILLAGGKLAFVSVLAPSKDRVLAEIANAKSEAEFHGIASAASLAGLDQDPDVIAAFDARLKAMRPKAPAPPAPPDTKPER